MSGLPLHPALVHLPLGLAFVVPLVAIGLLVAWRMGALPRKSLWIAVLLQAVLVAGAAAAMNTGESEEEQVEDVVPETAIEEHEERAEAFTYTSGAVLVALIAAAALPIEGAALGIGALAALGSLVAAGLGVWVGHAGGQLVYVHNAGAAYVTPATGQPGASGQPGAAGAAGEAGEAGEEDDD